MVRKISHYCLVPLYIHILFDTLLSSFLCCVTSTVKQTQNAFDLTLAQLRKKAPSCKKDGAKTATLTTCLLIRTDSNGLICFPLTEDSGKTYSAHITIFSPQLGSDFHCFSTDTGFHPTRLAEMFEKQLLSSSLL